MGLAFASSPAQGLTYSHMENYSMSFREGDIVEDIYYPGQRLIVIGVLENCLAVRDMELGGGMAGHKDRYRVIESSWPSVAYLELFQ